jgi:hypothetical protein
MNCGGCGRQRLWRLTEVTGRNREDVCQYSVSRYKYSQERYRLSHRAWYNVGINDPCMVKEFSNVGRHCMMVPVASDCGVSWADRVRVFVAEWQLLARCIMLLETTVVSVWRSGSYRTVHSAS